MKLYRCRNDHCDDCGKNFESDRPTCPRCGGSLVTELVPVHYLVPAEGPIRTGLGNRMVACNPKLATLPQSSGERAAVTCPKCIASAIFQDDERDGVDNHVPFFERQVADKMGRE